MSSAKGQEIMFFAHLKRRALASLTATGVIEHHKLRI